MLDLYESGRPGEDKKASEADQFEHLVQAELHRRRLSKFRRFGATLAWYGDRLIVRSMRITGGVVVGGIALAIGGWSVSILGKPFAALSPLELILSLEGGLTALALLAGAFGIAFGEGESRDRADKGKEISERDTVEKQVRGRIEDQNRTLLFRRHWPWWAQVLFVVLSYVLLGTLIAILGGN